MDTRSLAHLAHPSTEECPSACFEGLLFLGHLVEENESSEEVEVVEAVPCRSRAIEGRSPIVPIQVLEQVAMQMIHTSSCRT